MPGSFSGTRYRRHPRPARLGPAVDRCRPLLRALMPMPIPTGKARRLSGSSRGGGPPNQRCRRKRMCCVNERLLWDPPEAVASTSKVRNTADEAKAVAAMPLAGSTVLLITSAFHMPRAQRLFQRQRLSVLPFRWTPGHWCLGGQSLVKSTQPRAHGRRFAAGSCAVREVIGRTFTEHGDPLLEGR